MQPSNLGNSTMLKNEIYIWRYFGKVGRKLIKLVFEKLKQSNYQISQQQFFSCEK